MGYSKARPAEILKTILEISASQTKLAEEGGFEEVLALQERRETLIRELQALHAREEDLKALADEILKSDTELAGLIERTIGDFKSKLEKIGKTTRAVKAYTAY
ncbi:MAG: flagellar protein FliT [Deltaproteobacteria bacterium]|nr:flagellar protein FliT [Deltaproteobacteria bacterium]